LRAPVPWRLRGTAVPRAPPQSEATTLGNAQTVPADTTLTPFRRRRHAGDPGYASNYSGEERQRGPEGPR